MRNEHPKVVRRKARRQASSISWDGIYTIDVHTIRAISSRQGKDRQLITCICRQAYYRRARRPGARILMRGEIPYWR
jgi:hypothetical protein